MYMEGYELYRDPGSVLISSCIVAATSSLFRSGPSFFLRFFCLSCALQLERHLFAILIFLVLTLSLFAECYLLFLV